MQAKSKEVQQSLTESALVLSGAALLQAWALTYPELGLLKLRRALDLLTARVQENAKSASVSSQKCDVGVKADLDGQHLISSLSGFVAVNGTFLCPSHFCPTI
jgi:hypothetical protein